MKGISNISSFIVFAYKSGAQLSASKKWQIGPRKVGPWPVWPETVGPRDPIVGPQKVDSWAKIVHSCYVVFFTAFQKYISSLFTFSRWPPQHLADLRWPTSWRWGQSSARSWATPSASLRCISTYFPLLCGKMVQKKFFIVGRGAYQHTFFQELFLFYVVKWLNCAEENCFLIVGRKFVADD